MPRYNVNIKDHWICFSSIVDDFVTPLMPIEDYEKWRKDEYGRQLINLEQANKMDAEEAYRIIEAIHGEERLAELKSEIAEYFQ